MTAEQMEQKYSHLWAKDGIRGIAVGTGWLPLVHAFLLACEHARTLDVKIEIRQIKEKLGGLRVYWQGPAGTSRSGQHTDLSAPKTPEQDLVDAIDYHDSALIVMARHTCDVCGSKGSMRNLSGLLAVRCDIHANRDSQ